MKRIGVKYAHVVEIAYHGLIEIHFNDHNVGDQSVKFIDHHYMCPVEQHPSLHAALKSIFAQPPQLESWLTWMEYNGNITGTPHAQYEALRARLDAEGDEWRTVGVQWDAG